MASLDIYWDEENLLAQNRPDYSGYACSRVFNRYFSKPGTILDIGCGRGNLIRYYLSRNYVAYGIDISKKSLSGCQDLAVVEGDCRKLPFKDDSFDYVYSIGVVEHFKETHIAIKEHIRVCKPGGTVIVLVPNLFSPYFILSLVVHIFRGTFFKGYMIVNGKSYCAWNFRRYRFEKAEACYLSAGLRFLTKSFDQGLAEKIESNWLAKYWGHLLYVVIRK